jgi:uncharacterized protein YndB with AHSA1/START domain
MATSSITPDQDAVISEMHIAAPPDRIFRALTDPKQAMLWWDHPDSPIEFFSMEPKRGGRWVYDTKQTKLNVNGVSKFHCEGEVIEYDPPRVLAYTWVANWHLTPQSGGALVRVTHSGLAQERAAREDSKGGWLGVLQTLKNFVEKNK